MELYIETIALLQIICSSTLDMIWSKEISLFLVTLFLLLDLKMVVTQCICYSVGNAGYL